MSYLDKPILNPNPRQLPIRFLVVVLLIVVAVGLWGCPHYLVYQQRLEGEAALARASYERQVQIQDAQSKMEAAKDLAQAEIARAEGVAKANAIIGNSLKDNEAYLRWLYIEGLKEKTSAQVIYLPTEAGLPILEAGRRPATDK
jgi:regulator of protease activity HflC (stomatin/prohibitin superfamily)